MRLPTPSSTGACFREMTASALASARWQLVQFSSPKSSRPPCTESASPAVKKRSNPGTVGCRFAGGVFSSALALADPQLSSKTATAKREMHREARYDFVDRPNMEISGGEGKRAGERQESNTSL